MTIKFVVQAVAKLLAGIVLVGLLLFVSAGDMNFKNGWLLMGLLFIPLLVAGIVMMIKAPELLKKRLIAKEKQFEQQMVIIFSALMFLAGFIVAGLTYRFHWYTLPRWVVMVAAVVFLAGYILYAEVLHENPYLSRIVEIQEQQTVIDTGLYRVVRHPMYSATFLLFLSMPLVLGSVYSFILHLIYPFMIAKRIKSEEKFLEKELNGYCEYQKKVKYRLIPFIW